MTDWAEIAADPTVKAHIAPDTDFDWWTPLLAHPAVRTVESPNGGYFLVQLDPLGRTWELHAAFKPQGWGREAHGLLKAALRDLEGWDVILASEVAGNWRSRAPKSFGFRPAGPFAGQYRTWILTRAAWEASPARRRLG